MAALSHGSRKFYEIPKSVINPRNDNRRSQSTGDLFRFIENNCVGRESSFSGPFGRRKVIYCDFTASGRSLNFIEDYIREHVLPHYGNTHTTTTVTSLQTTLYRHEARDIIRKAVNASEADSVIFVGSGCTAAVHKLIHALNLLHPPVVFVGPYEHHSNLLPWREIGAEIVWIAQETSGLVNLNDLKLKLKSHSKNGRQLIGCFSAASNVTGILSDTNAITACLHQHGALAFWDYATAGPYTEINMNPVVISEDQSSVYKDAVFISPHKFVGGVSTPGILVAKKELFKNPVPSGCGGGSVFFVTENSHRYLREIEMREEGGTPAIVESVRAGMVFQLKEALGTDAIMAIEHKLCRQAVEAWCNHENLILLGNTSVPRLPIFSFLVRHKASGMFLHYNFVCALLNDLFGIQARGGCACAGPYAQDLLGLSESLAQRYESFLLEDSRLDRHHLRRYREYSEHEVLRPGFVRLNLPYFFSDNCVQFVLRAVTMVADHGWKLLPQYMFNPETGEWRHRQHQVFRDRKWLGSISYSAGHMTYPTPPVYGTAPPDSFEECLMEAEKLFSTASTSKVRIADQRLLLGEEAEALRWFLLPSEAADLMSGKPTPHLPRDPPFRPRVWNNYSTETKNSCYLDERNGVIPELTTTEILNEGKGCGGSECSGDRKGLHHQFNHNVNSITTHSSLVENNGSVSDCRLTVPKEENEKHDFMSLERFKVDNIACIKNIAPRGSLSEKRGTPLNSEGESEFTEDLNSSDSNFAQQTQILSSTNSDLACTNNKLEGVNPINALESKNVEQKTSKLSEACSCVLYKMENKSKTTSSARVLNGDVTEGDSSVVSTNAVQPKTEVSRGDCTFGLQQGDTNQQSLKFEHNEEQDTRASCTFQSRKDLPTQIAVRGKLSFQSPPKTIFKPAVQAIEEYEMINDGDKILVCLSGGKDSLSLLHTLHQYQYYARPKGINFQLGVVTVDPQSSGYDPRPLIPYLASLGLPYFYEEQGILQQASELPVCESICSFCSRMKRGRLYACARREGYNVLAMGQHLDDLAESFIMSAFHNGLLRTMKANYSVQEGDLRVIRPLVYVREKDLRHFAEKAKLPVIPENCPACFEAPKERHRTKQLLAAQELLFPNLYSSLLTAMRPLMARNRTGLESSRMKSGNYEDFL